LNEPKPVTNESETDRLRRQVEDLKAEVARLQQGENKAENLGRMAGAIAHRFNNLLGVVLGNLEMVMNVLPSESAAVENLIEAIQAARKTAEVSGLMLTYLGQSSAKADALDLAATCRRSLETIRSGMPKEVLLKHDLPSDGPFVRANAAQLQQALTNICTNAWEAIGAGRGTIQVAVKVVSADEIAAANRFPLDWHPREFPHACVEVADSGCGIAGKDMEKLFDPFFSSKFTGRGLGLPVVLGVAKACGGGVTVESRPGRGSTFRLFFPVEEQVPATQPDRAGQPFRFEAGGTVLLAEDDEMPRKLTAAALNGLGLKVIAAGDGDEAIEAFRRHQEEILFVLLDLTMPRVNGWEALEALRKLCPGVRVILTSGYSEAHVMNGEHLTLPNGFLAKPYDRNELISAVSRVLAGKDG
jgi:signal transduction histidine kinase/CheY-like chemotaxis protein